MKKVLFLFVLLILAAVTGVTVLILTFDANRFRPLIIENVQKTVGNPVTLEDISLTWDGGLALALRDLRVYPGDPQQTKPALSLDRATAAVNPFTLLSGKIQVGAITLDHPKLQVLKNPDGNVRVLGLNLREPAPEDKGFSAASLLISSLSIEDGEITYIDQQLQPPIRLPVKDIDIHLKDVSLLSPLRIDAKASLFSTKQNVTAQTRFVFPSGGSAAHLENLKVETDLSQINVSELTSEIPGLQPLGLRDTIQGKLLFQADHLPLDPEESQKLQAKLDFGGGRAALGNMMIQDLGFRALASQNQITLDPLSGMIGDGKISGSAKIAQWNTTPQISTDLSIQDVSIEKLNPPAGSGEAYFQGTLFIQLQGQAQGKTDAQITQSATGTGRIQIQNPVLKNRNILKEVLGALSNIPGLAKRLNERLPETYKNKLEAKDTVFEPIDLPISMSGGMININSLNVATTSFVLTGVLNYRLDGWTSAQMMLQIDSDLSNALIRSVEELSYLAGQDGRLQIPLKYQGPMAQFRPLPDLGYVASRLATQKAQDWIGGVLEKKLGKPQPETGTANGTSTGTQTSPTQNPAAGQNKPLSDKEKAQQLFNDLLGSFLEK